MPTRRHVIHAGAAASAAAVLPAIALAQDRSNPMPEDLRRALERDPAAPVLGNPDGNITLTEFFDYNCPFCRKMVGTVHRAILADPQLRVVFREWPVFGPGSEFAAMASLASLQQGKYWQFHDAMMRMRGPAEEASVMRIAREVGLDEARLRRDMENPAIAKHINGSQLLADHMGIVGTPMFIAGDEGTFGALTLDELQQLIARGRATLGVS